MEILDLAHTIEYAGTSVILACMFLICSLKPLAILQQGAYKNGRMLAWYRKKSNMLFWRYNMLSTMLFFSVLLFGVIFTFLGVDVAFRLTLVPFLFFDICFYFADRKYALKVAVNETERLKRLALVYYVLLAVLLYLLVAVLNVCAYYIAQPLVTVWVYLPLTLVPLALPFLVCLANAICFPFENARNKKYIRTAGEKLASSSAIKVGITGSFGKTSVKYFLTAMLQKKYKVLMTPSSYNTPMGIAKCVHENNLDVDVFVAEMGAKKSGDIAELCALVQPTYSVLTGVCPQHIESFGSVENVLSTKAEIVSGTKKQGAVLVGKDEYTAKLSPDTVGEFTFVSEENIKNVRSDASGTSFTFDFAGKTLSLSCALLGKHTAKNIALACALAMALGVSEEEIVLAVSELKPVPHRLEKTVLDNGVTVIDDGYNANIEGAENAIEALKTFTGRKIVVTPGIVELGVMEQDVNRRFGEMLAGLDFVILVGDTLVGEVKTGYLSAGGVAERITVCPTLEKAKEQLASTVASGDTVLFLNDLPDICM